MSGKETSKQTVQSDALMSKKQCPEVKTKEIHSKPNDFTLLLELGHFLFGEQFIKKKKKSKIVNIQ